MGNKILTGIFATLGIIMLTCMTLLFAKAVYKEYCEVESSTRYHDTCVSDCNNSCIGYLDYVFETAEDATSTQEEFQKEDHYVMMFVSMPPEVITTACNNVLKQHRQCGIVDIVDEYENNRSIYENQDVVDAPGNPVPLGRQSTSNAETTSSRSTPQIE